MKTDRFKNTKIELARRKLARQTREAIHLTIDLDALKSIIRPGLHLEDQETQHVFVVNHTESNCLTIQWLSGDDVALYTWLEFASWVNQGLMYFVAGENVLTRLERARRGLQDKEKKIGITYRVTLRVSDGWTWLRVSREGEPLVILAMEPEQAQARYDDLSDAVKIRNYVKFMGQRPEDLVNICLFDTPL